MKTHKTLQMLFAAVLLVTMPFVAYATDEPEDIFAKFHSATLAKDFDEMLKYGTTATGSEVASMPATSRQEMLDFLAEMLPKSYSVIDKTVDPDGNHAILRVTAMRDMGTSDIPGTVNGTVTLNKENGEWKVGKVNWGDLYKASKGSSKREVVHAASVKTPATRQGRHEPSDLRDCLNLQSNEAIAKCANASR